MPTRTSIKIAILVSVFALLASSSFFLLIKSKNEDASRITNEVAEILRSRSRIQSARHIATEVRDDAEKLSSYLVSRKEIVGFIPSIEAIAKEEGVKLRLNSVSEDNPNTTDTVSRLRLDLDVEGTFAATASFLYLIESLPLYISIDQSSLARISAEKGIPTWRGTLRFSVVMFPDAL